MIISIDETMMAKVAFWALFLILVVLFLSYYLDTTVPEDIPEKWKVRILDASMRTYGHLINCLVKLGITTPFSPMSRKLADWFVLAQSTGLPWGMSLTVEQRLKITDTKIAGVRVLMYEPVPSIRQSNRPVLIYMHGGGWSMLSADCYDPLMRKVARESGVVIISIDYRLSPENRYPTPLEDCLTVVNYVIDNAESLRIDPQRIAVGGDSAGGNMAASISIRLKNFISKQFLFVPVLQFANFRTSSRIENAKYFKETTNSQGCVYFVLNYLNINPDYAVAFRQNNHTSSEFKHSKYYSYVDHTVWMQKQFIRDTDLKNLDRVEKNYGNIDVGAEVENKINDPYVAPLMASEGMLRGLPEAYVITAGYDVLRDDGVMYAERLKSLGNKVHLINYHDSFHNALLFPHGPLKFRSGAGMINDLIIALQDTL